MAINPVSGMQVERESAATTYGDKGQTHYFCVSRADKNSLQNL